MSNTNENDQASSQKRIETKEQIHRHKMSITRLTRMLVKLKIGCGEVTDMLLTAEWACYAQSETSGVLEMFRIGFMHVTRGAVNDAFVLPEPPLYKQSRAQLAGYVAGMINAFELKIEALELALQNKQSVPPSDRLGIGPEHVQRQLERYSAGIDHVMKDDDEEAKRAAKRETAKAAREGRQIPF